MRVVRRSRVAWVLLFAAAVSCVLAVVYTGQANGGRSATSPKISFVCATPATASFFAPIEQGAKDAASELGVDLSYTGLGKTVSPAAMAQVLQPAVNQHPDVLIVCNFFPSAENPIIKSATAKGIPVILSNSISDAAKVGALGTVGQADFAAGQQGGQAMIRLGVKHPLCVNGVPDNPSVTARCLGFIAAFKGKGIGVKTLNLPSTQYNNLTAQMSAMKGTLAADRKIDGVLTSGPTLGPGAARAAQQLGRGNKVKVGTFDISDEVVAEVNSGALIFAIWQQPYLEGYLPVVAAALYARHGFLPAGSLPTGPVFVTKANVAKVKAALAAGLG
jgi:simple sugar transport system substrate-binding protein